MRNAIYILFLIVLEIIFLFDGLQAEVVEILGHTQQSTFKTDGEPLREDAYTVHSVLDEEKWIHGFTSPSGLEYLSSFGGFDNLDYHIRGTDQFININAPPNSYMGSYETGNPLLLWTRVSEAALKDELIWKEQGGGGDYAIEYYNTTPGEVGEIHYYRQGGKIAEYLVYVVYEEDAKALITEAFFTNYSPPPHQLPGEIVVNRYAPKTSEPLLVGNSTFKIESIESRPGLSFEEALAAIEAKTTRPWKAQQPASYTTRLQASENRGFATALMVIIGALALLVATSFAFLNRRANR